MRVYQNYRSGYVLLICFISALGGYLFGFDFAVISGALPFLKDHFGLDAYWEGFTTASLALGCIAGCFVAGKIAETYGRRPGLMTAAAIFAISSIAMAMAPELSIFIAARFVAGIGVGMASMLSPMYIAEVSPAAVRGRMVSIYQLAIVIGILVTNLINFSLRNNGDDAWRWMFALGAIPSAIFFWGVYFLPESPRWLIRKGKSEKAKKVLASIGDLDFLNATFASIISSVNDETKPTLSRIFKKPFRAAVFAGIGLAVFQQFCGINVVFNYTTTIFNSIGFNKDDQLIQTVFIGAVNLFFTFIAIRFVDKLGRKPLMFTGAAGLAILYVIIAISLKSGSHFSSIPLLAAIGLYATTLAPVTWVLISEIFPNKVRGLATTVAVISLWSAYFILTFTFPLLSEFLGGIANTFYVYAVVCICGAIFIKIRIRETKGKTLEEMDTIFAH